MTITVTVRLFASFRQLFPKNPDGVFFMKLGMNQTVRDMINQIGLPPDTPKIIFVNGVVRGEDTRVGPGDRISIFPHIAGG
jgi:molybdopterin converting factor small subunit